MLRRQRLDIGILQDIETLGIGLHQAIFDAIVNHLDEMPSADRTGVDVTLLDPLITPLASAGARDVADARRQRREDRVEAIDHRFVAADHHAIAALDAPDAAGGADIDVMDATLFQDLAAPHVVLPECIATIDDDVATIHQ